MPSAATQQARTSLESLIDRQSDINIPDWRALVEDTLKHFLPTGSKLLDRLSTLGPQASSPGTYTSSAQPETSSQIENEYRSLIRAACKEIAVTQTEPVPTVDPHAIELAITQGYFKSWPFRIVVAGILVVFTLIGGVASFKIKDQVDAMQRSLTEAKNQVEAGKEQVAQARSQVANTQTELSSLILQSNTQLLTAREKAITDLQQAERGYEQELQGQKTKLLSDLGETGNTGNAELKDKTKSLLDDLDNTQKQDKANLAEKVQTTINNLAATKSPWIPFAVWSTEKGWLIIILTLVTSLAVSFITAMRSWQSSRIVSVLIKAASSANIVAVTIIVILIYVRT